MVNLFANHLAASAVYAPVFEVQNYLPDKPSMEIKKGKTEQAH
jgi:hypothetical protein